MAMAAQAGGTMQRQRGGPSGLADVLDVLLDKGLVIDAFVRVSLVGIELLTVDARVVVASVDTYLRFAEAVNRLDLTAVGDHTTLPEMVSGERRDDGSSNGSRRDEDGEQGSARAELGSGRDGEDAAGGGDDHDESSGGLAGAIGKAAQKVRDRARYS